VAGVAAADAQALRKMIPSARAMTQFRGQQPPDVVLPAEVDGVVAETLHPPLPERPKLH
jgi:hypothetical protein